MMVDTMWDMMLETMLVDDLQSWILVQVDILQLGLDLLDKENKEAAFC
jgi:hypothetical protein